MNLISLPWLKKFLKDTFFTGLVISLPVFAWVRLIFFEVPFSITEDSVTLFKVVMTGWIMMIALKAGFYSLLAIVHKWQRSSMPVVKTKWSVTAVAVLVLCSMLYACNGQALAGVKKDFNTGLTATYKNIAPENVLLVMNDEILNHTDIPMGEKFLLVNEGIKGLKEKNGKVSVGCSLSITNQKGKKILEEADLFKGNDLYDLKDVEYLKCTVNTGKPMEWEEKYNVVATFWDKYGTGKITNKVTIRMIDMP